MSSTDLVFSDRDAHQAWLATQAVLPSGFACASHRFAFTPVEVGTRAQMGVNLIALDRPSPDFAAVFTRNAFPGAPVVIGRRRLDAEALRAIVINNKIANVATADGVATAERLCAAVGQALDAPATQILPSSTGVIGWRLPEAEFMAAIPELISKQQSDSVLPVAEGICTTDLYPKVRRATLGTGSIVGIAKGAGMIEPHLATMLVYLLTDIAIPRARLRQLLMRAVDASFNAITVDSDQSTSDTVALVSSGRIACDDEMAFARALDTVCADLAEDVVRNGEGVHHVVRITVAGAPDAALADGTARAVANSPLVQCAIAGNDANVGRLVMAVGKHLGLHAPDLDTDRCRIAIDGTTVFADGHFRLDPATESRLAAALRHAELYASVPPSSDGIFRPPVSWPPHERSLAITIDLGAGDAAATILGADRTHEYISENADYRS